MHFFLHISCLDSPAAVAQTPCSLRTLAIFHLLGQLPGPALGIFADHACSFPALFCLEYVFSSAFRDSGFGFVRIILIVF